MFTERLGYPLGILENDNYYETHIYIAAILLQNIYEVQFVYFDKLPS